MGDPVTYNYKGRTVKFCCNGCVKTFEKQPEAYIAKLDSAAAGLVKSPKAGA
jgi:YHS domain-containing protein